jgi:hypothetical protein
MAICETCGNDYRDSFTVRINGKTHHFDSFECAIEALSPRCAGCGVHILGHGIDDNGKIYCSRHCAPDSEATMSARHA